MTIAEVLASADGMPVVDLTATVTKVSQLRKITGQYGEDNVCDLTLSDGANTVAAAWWNPPFDPAQLGGKRITISAQMNSHNQLHGAKKLTRRGAVQIDIKGTHANLASEAAPRAATNGATQGAVPSGAMPLGAVPLSVYLEATGAAYWYALGVLEIRDEAAAVAYANTVGIALSQGRIAVDAEGLRRRVMRSDANEDYGPTDTEML